MLDEQRETGTRLKLSHRSHKDKRRIEFGPVKWKDLFTQAICMKILSDIF